MQLCPNFVFFFQIAGAIFKKELNCYNFPITVDDIKKPEIMQCDDFGDFRLSELFVLEKSINFDFAAKNLR